MSLISKYALLLLLFLAPLPAQAVELGGLRVNVITGGDLISTLGNIVDVVLLWAGILAFFYALYGGFSYLLAGGDNAKADNGRKIILNAVIGIIVISISFVLVNYVLGRTQSEFRGSGTSTTGGGGGSGTGGGSGITPRPRTPTPTPRSGGGGAGVVPKNNAKISGTVTRADGFPVDGLTVTATSGTTSKKMVLSTDGKYSLSSLPAGTYKLAITGANLTCDTTQITIANNETKTQDFPQTRCFDPSA